MNKTINLPTGKYLVSIYLDENLNNKMDYNFIGIPKEQYGFSTKKIIITAIIVAMIKGGIATARLFPLL